MTSCSNSTDRNKDTISSVGNSAQFWPNQFSTVEENQIITIENTEDGIYWFCLYDEDQLLKESIMQDDYEGCFFDAEFEYLYSYNRNKHQLEMLSKEFDLVDILISDLDLYEIKNIVRKDHKLYLLAVKSNPYETYPIYENDDNGYINFGEQLYEIDLESQLIKEITIDNPICIAFDEDNLQIYTYQQGTYELHYFDTKSEQTVFVSSMDEMGYLFSFACLEDWIFYSGRNYPGLWKRNIVTGENSCVNESALLIKGADLRVYSHRLYMLDHLTGKVLQYCVE